MEKPAKAFQRLKPSETAIIQQIYLGEYRNLTKQDEEFELECINEHHIWLWRLIVVYVQDRRMS